MNTPRSWLTLGSTTTIAKGDPSFGIMPLEVGAAIFVQANQNLMKLIRMFGLPAYPTGSNTGVKMNTWDGKNVVYTQIGVPWFDKLTSFFRYGLASPSRQAAAVATFVGRMAKTYAPSLLAQRGVVNSIEAYANSLQLGNEYTSKTGLKWATDTVGVSSLWANEFMDAATRTNVSGIKRVLSRPLTSSTAATLTSCTVSPRSRARQSRLAEACLSSAATGRSSARCWSTAAPISA